ncbi:aurora kinase A-interacting protein [Eublepharis macularius]|uniref:Small ribosomal subunit protein mS38 n=1 Tax=Eublepharis macularius TaxID=481883 RepID=A0AA97KLV4_EUBMA|nr:aurora kinase A-interacting protein [Eublepharis macularius]XP_054857636.1 aurora kinase A-interacting protein [Eublepharis macularius]
MLISRLTSQILRASRCTGQLLPRLAASLLNPGTPSVTYSTQPSSKNGPQSQQWYAVPPELEEVLVPRKMSISPLESWLTVHYSLPKEGVVVNIHERLEYEPTQQYDLPPCPRSPEEEGNEPSGNNIQCKNVLKIRRRKMNKHKYWKLRKRRKFVRKKVLEGRRRRKQGRFEKDLERIWRKAGLKKPPEGWVTPKIYLRNVKSD